MVSVLTLDQEVGFMPSRVNVFGGYWTYWLFRYKVVSIQVVSIQVYSLEM